MQKSDRLCVGLISGTSVDAAEAALCRIRGSGGSVGLELVRHASFPIDRPLRERLLAVREVEDLSELNFLLGGVFADAALGVIAQAKLNPDDVDVIGSHGQTIVHLPPGLSARPSTLQIGEASVIAERTGVPVVSDFRTRDVAVGGQGAPLIPYMDWAVFRRPGVRRALLNLGGIANVSVVTDRLEETVAFDTGPANMVLDALARRATGGQLGYDRDGELSARGEVLPELLEELLRHPFLALPPPKSAGREGFGESLVAPVWDRFASRPFDLLATAAEFTIEATARAFERFVLPAGPLEGVYVSGGGCRNPRLLAGLTRRLAPVPVRPLDVLGFPEAAKEAACFALLASECLTGISQNVPSATGATRSVILGKMSP